MPDDPGHEFGLHQTRLHASRSSAVFVCESYIPFNNRTSNQRSHFGGVCRLCHSQPSGDHHG